MAVTFSHVTEIGAPPEIVFDLSLDIDVHLASMAESGEQVIAGVAHGKIGLGEEVTWAARHFGITWKMTSRITELEPPSRFVDQQTHGPFASFVHEHVFAPSDTGTVMTDNIRFTAPLGLLGRVAERAWLGWYLPRLIAERGEFIKQAAERG